MVSGSLCNRHSCSCDCTLIIFHYSIRLHIPGTLVKSRSCMSLSSLWELHILHAPQSQLLNPSLRTISTCIWPYLSETSRCMVLQQHTLPLQAIKLATLLLSAESLALVDFS